MKNKWKTVLLVVVLLVIILAFLIWRPGNSSPEGAPAGYEAVTVEMGTLKVEVEGDGIITAPVRTQIISPLSAEVETVAVSRGDRVEAGDLLLQLKDDSLQLQIKQQEANIASLQLQLQQLEEEIDRLYLPSPTDGRLVRWLVSPGDRLLPQQVVAVLETPGLDAVFIATESQLGTLSAGMPAQAQTAGDDQLTGIVIERQSLPGGQASVSIRFDYPLDQELPGQLTLTAGAEKLPAASLERPQVEVFGQQGSRVDRLAVTAGETVSAGDPLLYYDAATQESQRQSLQLQLESARLSLEQVQAQKENLRITASQAGTVTGLSVTAGARVQPSQPLLTLVDYSELQVAARVDELDLAQLQLDQPVEIHTDTAPGKVFTGKVLEIAEEGVPQGGVTTFEVTISLEDNTLLKPGMNVQVRIAVAEKENVLTVPLSALQEKEGRYYVALEPEEGETEPVLQEIETGLYNTGFIEVTAGLQSGDRVLVPVAEDDGNFGPFGRGTL